jgi:hypothetical protein
MIDSSVFDDYFFFWYFRAINISIRIASPTRVIWLCRKHNRMLRNAIPQRESIVSISARLNTNNALYSIVSFDFICFPLPNEVVDRDHHPQ